MFFDFQFNLVIICNQRLTQYTRSYRRRPASELNQPASPYHRYNLRRNPFGELTRAERAELAVVEVEPHLAFLKQAAAVLQFIGPCGHGKTTHLLAIQRAMPIADYVYLPAVGPRPTVGLQRPLIVDESQRLSWWQLRRVLRRGGPLVLGTHVDHSSAIIRAGLEVRSVAVAGDTSIQRLVQILNQRIAASRFREGSLPCVTNADAIRLQSKFGANIRAIEQFLYEQLQHCISCRPEQDFAPFRKNC